jgi:5,10-methylene-tetrahydrofolate dehydrogenase/methenyl tetrahydrofolate cyclohydrolase
LVVAAGRPRTLTADMVKPGAVVIDVGVKPRAGRVHRRRATAWRATWDFAESAEKGRRDHPVRAASGR